jgi:Protein of unknown function (DUF3618)
VKAATDHSLDELELEIARTRARLAGTADALAAELAPPRLAAKGVDMLNGFLSRPDAVGLGGGFRADPVALALIALGAAWLVAENTGLLEGLIPERTEEEAPMPVEPVAALPAAGVGGERERAGEGGWFHQAADATHGALRQVYERGNAVVGQAGELIADPAATSGRVVERMGQSPLLLALAGIAAGAVIALLLPTSRREREIAARARDDLWERGEELSHRAAASVRDIAENVAREHSDY